MLLANRKGVLAGAALCVIGASSAHADELRGEGLGKLALTAVPATVTLAFSDAPALAAPEAPTLAFASAIGSEPATVAAVRSRRGRWQRQARAGSPPRYEFGGSIASWEPRDAQGPDAMLQGYVRGYFNRTTALQVEGGYWSHDEEYGPVVYRPDSPQPQAAYATLRDMPVGASLLYFLRPQMRGRRAGASASLYGGIGVAWHNWREEQAQGYPPQYRSTRTAFGYHYIAGLQLGSFSGGRLFGEYRYTVGRVDDLGGAPLTFDGSSIGGGIGVAF